MIVSRIKTTLFAALLLASLGATASINPSAMNTQNAQMVNLNLQLKSRNRVVKSDLTMPFYQTAELEKKVGDKNVLIEMSPKRGKNADEIALVLKFYKASGSKAFAKKEIIAKVNEESYINLKGLSVKVKPVL